MILANSAHPTLEPGVLRILGQLGTCLCKISSSSLAKFCFPSQFLVASGPRVCEATNYSSVFPSNVFAKTFICGGKVGSL